MRDDGAYLQLISESIAPMMEYITEMAEEPSLRLFAEDLRTQDAVLRRMEILADAASHLSSALQSRHPDIPWRKISDFRNVLAHAYMEVELDLVWSVIEEDLPALKALVQKERDDTSRP